MVQDETNTWNRSNKIHVVTLFTTGRGNLVFYICTCYLPFLLAWEPDFQDYYIQSDAFKDSFERIPWIRY
jgi:hypothetical protein